MSAGKMLRQHEALAILRTFWERTVALREVTPVGPMRAALDTQEEMLAERWDALQAIHPHPFDKPGRAFLFDLPPDVYAAIQAERGHHDAE